MTGGPLWPLPPPLVHQQLLASWAWLGWLALGCCAGAPEASHEEARLPWMLAAELGVCVLGSQSMSLPSLQEFDVQTNEQ